MRDVTWAIGGEAGFGIMASGTMLAKAFSRTGYGVIAINEYPSLVRGGHNFVSVRITTEQVTAPKQEIDILVALNRETVSVHKKDLAEHAYVMVDPKDGSWNASELGSTIECIPVPFFELVTAAGGDLVMRNTVAIGATLALLGKELEMLSAVVRDQFKGKGEKVIADNIEIAQKGYNYIQKQYAAMDRYRLEEGTVKEPQLVMNASEAVALGAVAGGMKFAAIYPMTPINALIPIFADHAAELGVVYKQPEDEIAGINMAIGASLAGARSMVATSGGGFALMVEAVSMAGIMEVPIVINLGMRPGPATGMPTWTEQGELQMVLRAGHGEFPRIIIAPGDVEEAFELTKQAFTLADTYQTPVFILTDKYINETLWQLPQERVTMEQLTSSPSVPKQTPFKRYDMTSSTGISKRSFPGQKACEYVANSYEHDEYGYTTEDAQTRKNMVEKRLRKMDTIKQQIPAPTVYGKPDADVTFVSFGSLKGVVLEAIRMLENEGLHANGVHFSYVFPMVEETVKRLIGTAKRLICVEQNATGQLASLIREETGISIDEQWHKYDGREWTTEELVARTKGLK